MGLKLQVSLILSLALLAASIARAQPVFDVRKYGARADGKTDISKAIINAWKGACASKSPSKILIPKGTYLSGPVSLVGPCASPIKFQHQGILKAPAGARGDSWINFQYINGLTLFGGGTFDGQGESAWSRNNCAKSFNCKQLPINIRFDYVTNSGVMGVTSLNSKNFHINVLGCKNLTFESVAITAPGNSPNTDGIHIAKSSGISVINSAIKTGDDCVSLGDGSEQIRVTGVTCGPGHGISVGSLGRYPNEQPVSGFFVQNCTLTGTQNGVRIKSWPGRYGNSVSNMHFENIFMNKVSNPILIDQGYCPWNQCNRKSSSNVKISDIGFKNIRGTSATPVVVQLSCSASSPCQNVKLANVDIRYNGGAAKSECSNVRPIMTGILSAVGCGKNA